MTFNGGVPIVPLDDPAAFAAELDRQIEPFVALIGRSPTHLDAHHNIHRYAPLTPVFQRAADRVGMPLRDANTGALKLIKVDPRVVRATSLSAAVGIDLPAALFRSTPSVFYCRPAAFAKRLATVNHRRFAARSSHSPQCPTPFPDVA